MIAINKDIDEDKGWSIFYYDYELKEYRIAGRFKTTKEKDMFLERIHYPIQVGHQMN